MIVMNEGNVEHIGTPLEVYTKPKDFIYSSIYWKSSNEYFKKELRKIIK